MADIDSTKPQLSPAQSLFVDLVYKALILGLIVFTPIYVYRSYEDERAHWLTETLDIRDPWTRYTEFSAGLNRWLTDEQRDKVEAGRDAAIEEAVAARDPNALQRIEDARRYYPHLIEKYPRHPEQREAHLRGLRVVWPQLDTMAVTDRVALLFMAEECHLHEALQPFDRQTVLDCIRVGASMREDRRTLDRLLVSAVLGGPITRHYP